MDAGRHHVRFRTGDRFGGHRRNTRHSSATAATHRDRKGYRDLHTDRHRHRDRNPDMDADSNAGTPDHHTSFADQYTSSTDGNRSRRAARPTNSAAARTTAADIDTRPTAARPGRYRHLCNRHGRPLARSVRRDECPPG